MMQVDKMQESVTVSGEAPLLDTTAVLNQTVMTREVLDVLPDTNNVWSIGRLVPAVIQNNIDVGGTGAFQQSTTSVHGSRGGSETNYLIDGMNIGSVSGDGGIQIYYDPFMFEQLNYQTGGVSAETSRGRLRLQHGDADRHQQAARLVHVQRHRRLPAVQQYLARAAARSFCSACRRWRWRPTRTFSPVRRVLKMYDLGLTVTGPILMDKLWFVGTLKRTFLDQYRVGSYNPDGTQFVDDNKMVTYSGKLSYAMSSASQLHYTYLYSNKQRFHRSGNSLTDFWESASTHLQELEGHVNQAKWTKTLSSKMVMDVSGEQHQELPASGPASGGAAGRDRGVRQPSTRASWWPRRSMRCRAIAGRWRTRSLSYCHGQSRSEGGLPVGQRAVLRREFLDLGHARGRSQRRARFGQYLQHAGVENVVCPGHGACSSRTNGRPRES